MIQVDRDSKLSDTLKCHFFVLKSHEKTAVLLYTMQELIKQKNEQDQTIIFCATRYHVEYLQEICSMAGFKTTYIYGVMDQQTREERLMKFRQKKIKFLIVTDLAARGIDIPLLQNVIHFDYPPNKKLFIHRSGRTARAGQKGISYALITGLEMAYLHDLSIFTSKKYADCPDSLKIKSNAQMTEEGEAPKTTATV